MANYIFRTPKVKERPAGVGRLFSFYGLDKGITIVKSGGVYSQTRYLLDSDLATYQEVYLGGRDHIVDDATRSALIAGSVGVTAANFTAI